MNYLAIIDKSAQEMQRNYFEHEFWYDIHKEFDTLGMDNVSGNFGTYDLEYYLEQNDRPKYVEELHRMFVFYYTIMWMAECKGYGFNAASRGFDVTTPYGVLWTRCERAIFALATLCEKYKVANLGWAKEAIADARKIAK